MLSHARKQRRLLVGEPGTILLEILLLVGMLSALAGCATKTPYPLPEFTSFDSFVDTLEAVAGNEGRADVDAFWNSLAGNRRVPFVPGDRVAFLHRGRARSVSWVGDFTEWQHGPAPNGRQVGQSGIWLARATFPANARP